MSLAAGLLAASASGVAADFREPQDSRRVAIKTAGQVAYSAGLDTFFANAQNMVTATRVRDKTGAWQWSPHNLYLNSDAPATQTVTVISGATYTVSVAGSGSLTLSNAHSAVVTAANSPYTFTAASTSLVSTKSGTLTRIQINEGSTATAYLATTSAVRYASPISYDKTPTAPYLLIEPTADQYLANTSAPATQTQTLPAGTYTLWCEGSGSVALSGGPTGTATEDNPVTFTLGGSTAVTFTKTGTLTLIQCTNTSVQTSEIPTYSAVPRRRWRPDISASLSGVPSLTASYAFFLDFSFTGTLDNCYVMGLCADANNYAALRIDGSANVIHRVKSGGVQTASSQGSVTVTAGARQSLTAALRAASVRVSLNGSPFGGGGNSWGLSATPTPTQINLGKIPGDGVIDGVIKVYRIAVTCGDLPSHRLSQRFYSFTPDPTPYDIFTIEGQSNTYFGLGLDGTDVSGGVVDQLNAATGAFTAADEPLKHPVPAPGYIGFGLKFARDYYYPSVGRKVLLLPCGVSATGFSDSRWGDGNDLYERALNMIGIAQARFPNATLKGVLWMQGEKEAAVPWTQSQYATAFDAMVTARRAIYANLPYVVGSMVPPYVAANPTWQPVQDALAATPGRLAHTAYANGSGLGISTDVHYDAPNQRLFAARWWTAWQSLT